jgi:hypothetical protein
MIVVVDELNDDNRDHYFKLALSMYLGERCKYCGVTFNELDDLKDTVWAGYHQWGRLAHKTCWDKNNEPQTD